MNISVVTAIIGGIDEPKEFPSQHNLNLCINRFLVLADHGKDFDDRKKALQYKCQPHHIFSGDIFIWIDGKVRVNSHDFVGQVLAALGDDDLAVLKHGTRSCIYEEVDYIEKEMNKGNLYLLKRYRDKPIREQVEGYRRIGYPVGAGLFDCSVMAIRNNQATQDVFEYWWREIRDYDAFDQTALPFAAWRLGMKIKPIILTPGTISLVRHKLLK